MSNQPLAACTVSDRRGRRSRCIGIHAGALAGGVDGGDNLHERFVKVGVAVLQGGELCDG